MTKPTPKKFLKVVNRTDEGDITGLTACAGFELNKWRAKKLADHLVNWLPHFALRSEEIDSIGMENPLLLLKQAAHRIFKPAVADRRGEVGELLLHIIAVTEYRAHAFVSRLYYKMRSNDQITGFDSALVTVNAEQDDEVELWLGEAKFYQSRDEAIRAAILSIHQHLEEGFLEETKILVGPKIEPSTPGYEKLQWLFEDGNTLDEIVKRIVVPVLIASESDAVAKFGQKEENYDQLVFEEYVYISSKFADHELSKNIKIVLFYVPLESKRLLQEEFTKTLEAVQ